MRSIERPLWADSYWSRFQIAALRIYGKQPFDATLQRQVEHGSVGRDLSDEVTTTAA